MKSSFLAFLLNFFLPGAGLAYLGKWQWGLINLGAVLGIGLLAGFLPSGESADQYLRYVAFGCAGGSGGFAQALAKQMNARVKPPDEDAPA